LGVLSPDILCRLRYKNLKKKMQNLSGGRRRNVVCCCYVDAIALHVIANSTRCLSAERLLVICKNVNLIKQRLM